VGGDRARVALGRWRAPWWLPDLVGVPLTREALLPAVERGMAEPAPARNGSSGRGTMARNAAVRALLLAGGAR
jgi:hypothetical protein